MLVESWPIDKPKPYAKNARKVSPTAVDKVAASIKEFGWRQPIVVDEEGIVVVGHTRLLSAKKLGLSEVPIHVAQDLTPAQIKTYRLMDNRSHEETDWDTLLLAPELSELQALAIDLSLTGFDVGELNKLLPGTEGLTDDDACPEPPEVPTSRVGDIWLLGGHRLLCGDSTEQAAIDRLLSGDRADLVFMDSPYNVAYEGYTHEKLTIAGDKMPRDQYVAFLCATFRVCRAVVKAGASMYVCHASSWQREFQDAIEQAGFAVRCQIIWSKNTFAWGHARYKFQHEPLFYCHVDGQSDAWYGDKSQSTVWHEKKPAANRVHPTMKPVELIKRALANSSKAGDLVVDLFGGSGSALIACEKTARHARLAEIDPRYADVTVTRWQDFTGTEATLDADGRTFAEIKSERFLTKLGAQNAMKEEVVS